MVKPLGVPKGALTVMCALALLLKLKLALDNVAVPVMDPLVAVTTPTELLEFICSVPPSKLIAEALGSALPELAIKVP